jgi:predicted double-glycine peptidase
VKPGRRNRLARRSCLWSLGAPLAALASLAAAAPAFWLDVPFIRQQKDGCGSASIAMVMQYWIRQGSPVAAGDADPEAIRTALHSQEARGIFASDMVRYFEAKGFRAFTLQPEWAELERHLQKGRPLIVCLGRLGSGALHYVVVAGMDPGRKLILVNDPARRKLLAMDRKSFERAWRGMENWTLLAVPAPGG